jgi:hypothetical protein
MLKGMILTSLLAVSMSAAWAETVPLTPDPEMTTGDYCDNTDPNFEGYRYEEKIPYCRRAVSRHMKKAIYNAYGIPERCKANYTVDHLIPLSMGGSNAPENLWPEHRRIKATRQTLEQEMYDQLRRGEITQEEAVAAVVEAKMNPPEEPAFPDTESCQK